LLPVENPRYLFVRERVLQPWKKAKSLFTKKKESSSSKPLSTISSRRHLVSDSPRGMEEDTTLPRRNYTLLLGGMRATRSSSMRFTKPQGRTEEPRVPPRHLTRSSSPPPYAPLYSDGFIIMTKEEEKKLTRLEKRLVANVDFDDQALQLGFHTDIYYRFVCNSPTECR
jgi:hypothetical protein